MSRKPCKLASSSIRRLLRVGMPCAYLAVAAVIMTPAHGSEATTEGAMRLLQSSGFDAMLRHDARLDATLRDAIPESMPPELRTQIAGALDKTLGYAEMRRVMAEAVSSRLDATAIDRNLRWWASSTGQAVSAAQFTAFRQLTDQKPGTSPQSTQSVAEPKSQESPFARQLPDLARTSRSVRECLRMTAGFRRECSDAQTALRPDAASSHSESVAANILRSPYAQLSGADLAAFRVYLNSPGAREAVSVLGESYLQTKLSLSARAHRSIDDAVERFARSKIGGEADPTLRRVIALVDEGRSLEEARLILHFLRSVAPRDPRVLVELTRVAIKQAPAENRPYGEPPAVDPEFLDDAQGWMDRAIALEPRRADTLVLAGHLAYLKYQYPESIAVLERARRIGTTNPWLPLNLADALWALGRNKEMDRAYLGRAAQELETALAKRLPSRMQWQAAHSLAYIYGDLKDFTKARVQFQRLISSSADYDKAAMLREYAGFLLLTAGDVDGAIAAGRQAASAGEFEMGHSILAEALLIKAGRLFVAGKRADADKLVQEATRAEPELVQHYSGLARFPLTLPAVFALHEANVIGDLSSSEGGLTLLLASAHAGAADLERLIKWRADPNYLDPEEGTPLHRAILARNLVAIRTLLALGADVGMRDQDGLTPLEHAEQVVEKSEPKGGEILRVLRAAAGRNPNASPVGTPLKAGYIYRALKRISGDRFGHDLEVGEQVTFEHNCKYSDAELACLAFRDPANKGALRDVALAKEQLVTWHEWFQEIGPAPTGAR